MRFPKEIFDFLDWVLQKIQEVVGFSAMTIAELSILGSFLIFLALFIKKVWPVLMSSLDAHIEKVKTQISSAERLREESAVALTRANQISSNIQNEVEDYKRRSEERIAQLEEENRQYIQALKEKAVKSLNAQLNAELSKQKELLLGRLADIIVERLSEKVQGQISEVNFSKEDLKKLI
jgi:F0F1-type ATP synthase membrane subunit b/b'